MTNVACLKRLFSHFEAFDIRIFTGALLRRPNRWRLDVVSGMSARVFSARAGEHRDKLYAHVMIALDLAGEAQAGRGGEASGGDEFLFRLGHGFGLAGGKENAAGGAAGIAATGMELIRLEVVDQGIDEARARGDFYSGDVFNSKCGHEWDSRGKLTRGECGIGENER